MNSLEAIFGELGISQYLGAFVDQGFDSWETILDITESDLDALGVKLGHRRKLQRRIANYRGVAPDASLVSPTRTSIEDAKFESTRTDIVRTDSKDGGSTVAKRKYRRHPKPDENAPERPPSAYVLFSNKMREDLKGQNLTFTEIAKLVGENWQNLDRVEKEPFERQAQEAKEKYNRDLAEYKKTPEFRKYNDYLHEFRKRQAIQLQEKDASKRLKTESDSTRGSSTSGGSMVPSGTTSAAGSGSDSQPGSEPPPSRQQRMGSVASMPEPHFPGVHSTNYADETMQSPRTSSIDDTSNGRPRGLSSPSPRDPTYPSARRTGWMDSQRITGEPSNLGGPWLDPRGAPGTLAHSPESTVPCLTPNQSHGSGSSGRGSRSSGSTSASRPPSLKTDQSSSGSMSSLSSMNAPRTPSDASLPIHALLSSKPEPLSYVSPQTLPPQMSAPMSQVSPPLLQPPSGRRPSDQQINNAPVHGNGIIQIPMFSRVSTVPLMLLPGFLSGPPAPQYPGRTLGPTNEPLYGTPLELNVPVASRPEGGTENGLDGISALLRAREIVDRRS
ncbi:hypothetical protein F5X99DRAFT_38288 [Biscogniauxia marginata]|nr:hypothetical protein F5X99DRAFT_38288 [Biscogniauxia marginata]